MSAHDLPTLLDVREALDALSLPGRGRSGAGGGLESLGVADDEVTLVVAAMFPGEPFSSLAPLERFVRQVWRGAEVVEERRFALAVLALRGVQRVLTDAALPLYEHLIVTGAATRWVDEVGQARVGALHAKGTQALRRALFRWSRGENPWLRRAALVSQVGRGARVDAGLVLDCVAPSLQSPVPVVQEAVGLALLDLARWAPADVKRFLAAHRGEVRRSVQQQVEKGLRQSRGGRRR